MELVLLMYSGHIRLFENEEILGKTSALGMTTVFFNLVYIVVLISSRCPSQPNNHSCKFIVPYLLVILWLYVINCENPRQKCLFLAIVFPF
jgi:hypothetical protein